MSTDNTTPSTRRFLGLFPKDSTDEEIVALIKARIEALKRADDSVSPALPEEDRSDDDGGPKG